MIFINENEIIFQLGQDKFEGSNTKGYLSHSKVVKMQGRRRAGSGITEYLIPTICQGIPSVKPSTSSWRPSNLSMSNSNSQDSNDNDVCHLWFIYTIY